MVRAGPGRVMGGCRGFGRREGSSPHPGRGCAGAGGERSTRRKVRCGPAAAGGSAGRTRTRGGDVSAPADGVARPGEAHRARLRDLASYPTPFQAVYPVWYPSGRRWRRGLRRGHDTDRCIGIDYGERGKVVFRFAGANMPQQDIKRSIGNIGIRPVSTCVGYLESSRGQTERKEFVNVQLFFDLLVDRQEIVSTWSRARKLFRFYILSLAALRAVQRFTVPKLHQASPPEPILSGTRAIRTSRPMALRSMVMG